VLFFYRCRFTASDGRWWIIESGCSAEFLETVERHLLASLLIGLPVLLICAAGGGYVLVQRAMTPIGGMIDAAEALTFNSPHKRLPLAGTGDRIDALGRTLNRMLERLDAAHHPA